MPSAGLGRRVVVRHGREIVANLIQGPVPRCLWDHLGVGLVAGIVIVLFVLVGIPLLCRMLIRRMAASEGLREFLNAYGPRFPVPGRGGDQPEDGSD